MADRKTTEVATETRPYQSMIQRIQSQAAMEAGIGGDNAALAFELATKAIDRIAEADTLDALFDANESGSLAGVEQAADMGPLTLLEIEFRKSRDEYIKGGVGVYAYVKSVTDRGEEFEWNTGAPNVVTSLYRIQELGLLNKPEKPRIKIKGRQATNGVLYTVGRP